ncbi:MAG: nucleotidyltransferase family protein [Pseudomonadota bacterium]
MIALVVLAAGLSRRMGDDNKLLAQVGGIPLFHHALGAAITSDIGPVYLVHGDTPLPCPASVKSVRAGDAHMGQAHSLRAGIQAAQADGAAAAFVLLGDMPLICADTITALARKAQSKPSAIWRPSYQGKPGHPVYWPQPYFKDLLALGGDDGAKPVLLQSKDNIAILEWSDDSVVFDVDTPQALKEAQRRLCP